MAIRNAQIGGTDWTSENPTSADMNDTFDAIILSSSIIGATNLIRMLIDRSIDFSKGNFDWWGDAYVDSDGQVDSVSAATARYYSVDEKYGALFATTGSAEAADWSDTENSAQTTQTITVTVTATCIPTTVSCTNTDGSTQAMTVTIIKDGVTIATKVSANAASGTVASVTFTAADYTGYWESTSTNQITLAIPSAGVATNNAAAGYSGTLYSIGAQELWINDSGNEIEVTEVEADDTVVTITQDIPTGTFGATITKAIGVPFISDWETGADIKYKVTGTGGTEDSGWLDYNEVSSFTAFTAEPDTLIIQLTPKTAGTINYPSIKGFSLRCS